MTNINLSLKGTCNVGRGLEVKLGPSGSSYCPGSGFCARSSCWVGIFGLVELERRTLSSRPHDCLGPVFVGTELRVPSLLTSDTESLGIMVASEETDPTTLVW